MLLLSAKLPLPLVLPQVYYGGLPVELGLPGTQAPCPVLLFGRSWDTGPLDSPVSPVSLTLGTLGHDFRVQLGFHSQQHVTQALHSGGAPPHTLTPEHCARNCTPASAHWPCQDPQPTYIDPRDPGASAAPTLAAAPGDQ